MTLLEPKHTLNGGMSRQLEASRRVRYSRGFRIYLNRMDISMSKFQWQEYKSPEEFPKELIGVTVLFQVIKHGDNRPMLVTGTFYKVGSIESSKPPFGFIGGRFHYDWHRIVRFADITSFL